MSETPAGWRAAATAAALLFLSAGCSASREAGPRASVGEGVVVIARGSPVLLDVEGTPDFVALEPGAALLGIQGLRELRPGDRVRFTWTRQTAGVKFASKLEVDPYVRFEPEFHVGREDLLLALSQPGGPVVLDARPPERYAAGHLPTAVSLPWDVGDDALAAVPASSGAGFVVYGEDPRDQRAGVLARRLLAARRAPVRVLEGGFSRWLEADVRAEVAPADAAAALERSARWVVVDARPSAAFAAGTIPGAVSIPPEGFRWQEFDGTQPVPPLLLFGEDGDDTAPIVIAERIRSLRSQAMFKTDIHVAVLAGGFAAWQQAGLRVVPGDPARTSLPYVPIVASEIGPEEFERLWAEHGGARYAFLDVRRSNATREDWVHKIPLEELADRLAELPRDREYVLFCTIGERSHVGAALLRKNGYTARFLRARSSH